MGLPFAQQYNNSLPTKFAISGSIEKDAFSFVFPIIHKCSRDWVSDKCGQFPSFYELDSYQPGISTASLGQVLSWNPWPTSSQYKAKRLTPYHHCLRLIADRLMFLIFYWWCFEPVLAISATLFPSFEAPTISANPFSIRLLLYLLRCFLQISRSFSGGRKYWDNQRTCCNKVVLDWHNCLVLSIIITQRRVVKPQFFIGRQAFLLGYWETTPFHCS
jgi:hypothetical protein